MSKFVVGQEVMVKESVVKNQRGFKGRAVSKSLVGKVGKITQLGNASNGHCIRLGSRSYRIPGFALRNAADVPVVDIITASAPVPVPETPRRTEATVPIRHYNAYITSTGVNVAGLNIPSAQARAAAEAILEICQ